MSCNCNCNATTETYCIAEPTTTYCCVKDFNECCMPRHLDAHMYLSGDFNLNGMKIYIKDVIYSNPATIIFWSDGSKTVCKCSEGDVYSKETGLAICVLKKLVGATKVHDVFEDWIIDDKDRVTIKDVRRKKR